jgi:hypothetical protein
MNKINDLKKIVVKMLSKFKGVIDFEGLKDEIEPFVEFNPEHAHEMEVERVAREVIKAFKDPDGVRDIFSYKIKDTKGFANITFMREENLEILEGVRRSLKVKLDGIQKSLVKVEKKIESVKMQPTIFDVIDDNEKLDAQDAEDAKASELIVTSTFPRDDKVVNQ